MLAYAKTGALDIQRDEAYASAVLIQLINRLGVGPTVAPRLPTRLQEILGSPHGWRSLDGFKLASRTSSKPTFRASPMIGSAVGFRSF